MQSINPATGNIIRKYKVISNKEAADKVDTSYKAFLGWRCQPIHSRAQYLNRVADLLEKDKQSYAKLITTEMGKTYTESLAEIEKCAWVCRYYAEHARQFLKDEKVETNSNNSFITYQPLGPVLAIMPWNFPFWQVWRFAAPALMAGNTALLKHASNVPGCAEAIEVVCHEAGLPEGIFCNLPIASNQVENVIAHPHVQAVTLTGSEKAGKSVAAIAGTHLKKTVLELGGNDAYIILSDANIVEAASLCAKSRLINAGQSCIAAKRFIVVADIYEEFLTQFKQEMVNATMGDPFGQDITVGPQATKELRDALHQQVLDSLKQGATCILGGQLPEGEGFYYPPTILADVKKNMPAYSEELFGPVASVIKVGDEAEAIRVANDSRFGLAGAIFTADVAHGTMLARERFESGACFVNGFAKSDPRLPFGGIKHSGYGRELSTFGIREFVNIKTVSVC